MKKKEITIFVDKAVQRFDAREMAFVDRYETEHGLTPVEKVSEEEIYLLEKAPKGSTQEWLRGRRVCGFLCLKGDGRRFRCRNRPGARTGHRGWGRCYLHENIGKGIYPKTKMLRMAAKSGWAMDLDEMVRLYPQMMDDEELRSADFEVMVARFMLMKALNAGQSGKEIANYVQLGLEAKKVRSKIESEKLLFDIRVLSAFVNHLFEIMRKKLGKAEYSDLVAAIQEELLVPSNLGMRTFLENKDNGDGSEVVGQSQVIGCIENGGGLSGDKVNGVGDGPVDTAGED